MEINRGAEAPFGSTERMHAWPRRSIRNCRRAKAGYTARQMRAVDIIMSKRDGRTLSRDEIRFFVDGVTAGTLPDYQASALLMAIVLKGMSPEETATLTDSMV